MLQFLVEWYQAIDKHKYEHLHIFINVKYNIIITNVKYNNLI